MIATIAGPVSITPAICMFFSWIQWPFWIAIIITIALFPTSVWLFMRLSKQKPNQAMQRTPSGRR